MAKITDTCTSCGTRLLGRATTAFPCPGCLEVPIGRCARCRDQSVTYECSGCGFRGP